MNKLIGVIGAGVMGTGVSQSFAQNGFEVILVDISKDQLERSKTKIKEGVRFHRHLSKDGTKPNLEEVLGRIRFTTDMRELSKAGFIVENVTENWEIKKAVYEQLRNICSKDCILGVNTSAISITRVASLVDNPQRVIGIHFMNPVPLKPCVEVIRAVHTSEETIGKTRKVLQEIGKSDVIVQDSVGFVTNRAMMIFINEAVFMLYEHVASAADIDKLFIQCFGHKMGPLQTADLIGVDTILKSLEVLYDGFNDDKYRPCPLLKKMVDAGHHGMKNGRGFYDYTIEM